MIIDELTELATSFALNTGAPGVYTIGDAIDTARARDLGTGTHLFLTAVMVQAATSGGAASLALRIVTSDSGDLAAAETLVQSGPVAVAGLSAGRLVCSLPLPSARYRRYLGIQQVTTGAAFTGGSLDAFLSPDPNAWRAYADSIT